MHKVSVELIDDTAIEQGEYMLELAAGENKGKFIAVWKRQADDSWKWRKVTQTNANFCRKRRIRNFVIFLNH